MSTTKWSLPNDPQYSNITKLQTTLVQTPTLTNWESLLQEFTRFINTSSTYDPLLKSALFETYNHFLQTYPYYTNHWQNWVALEYKMNGIDSSLKVMRLSVELYPCVELYVDYISALIQNETEVDDVRLVYLQALQHNEFDFNGELLWDKIFEYEKDTELVLQLYLRVIKVPCYAYAKYYNQFIKISKSYDIGKVISEGELVDYLTRFGKSMEELSLIDKHQIIDDWSYNCFIKTQEKVNSIWKYESELLNQKYHSEVDPKQVDIWLEYLDTEIGIYSTSATDVQYKLVITLFQRCLVPNCHNESIWIKYLKFVKSEFVQLEQIHQLSNKFIPLTNNKLRFAYIYLLIKFNQPEETIFQYFIDLLKLFTKYKAGYLETIDELITYLQSTGQFQVDQLINEYLGIHKKKQQSDKLAIFQPYFTDSAMGLIITRYLPSLADPRPFFLANYKHKLFTNCIGFWKFYIEYEALQHNLINVNFILTYIKKHIVLPKVIMDQFIDIAYELSTANLLEELHLNQGKSNVDIIKRDLHKSNSTYYNGTKTSEQLVRQIGHPTIMSDSSPQITNLTQVDLSKPVEVPPFPTFRNVEKAALHVSYPEH
ncbi:Pre-mRNA-processing factor 39 [Spathaspora sp. JA1]|nr:Pre-mRNA-processing factor 39 [Spathaspora sp. JA1]